MTSLIWTRLIWQQWTLITFLFVLVAAAGCFVYHYSKMDWRGTEYGRHIMYSAHAAGIAAVLGIIHEGTGRAPWTLLLLSAACVGVAGALFRQCWMVRTPAKAEQHAQLSDPKSERTCE